MPNQQTRKEFLNLSAVSGFSFLLGSQNFLGQKAAAASPNATEDHPNVTVIKRYYAAYGRRDLPALRQIFAPNITWTIPGHHSLAGVHRGQDQVFAFFQQLEKAKFQAEVLFLGGNDSYVVDVHRGWSNLERDNIDILWALLFKVQAGRITEAVNFPGDQHAADAFYLQTYRLKPLPDRLA